MVKNDAMSMRPPPGAPSSAVPARAALPGWRCPALWLVWGGPMAAILASSAVAVAAFVHGDAELPALARLAGPARAVAATRPDAPALQGRNHAATPRRPE